MTNMYVYYTEKEATKILEQLKLTTDLNVKIKLVLKALNEAYNMGIRVEQEMSSIERLLENKRGF